MHESPPRLRTLDRSIPRDLEIIVHKAIDRDPSHRYQTAGELAADLQRFIGDEPILARRSSPFQLAGKWARRHRAIVYSAAAATAVIVVSTFAVLYTSNLRIRGEQSKTQAALDDARTNYVQAQNALAEANANFDLAFQAAEETLAEAGDELNGVPHFDPVYRSMLEKALLFFEKLAEKRSSDPRIKFRTAQAAERVGHVRENLGRNAEALQAYNSALRMMDELIAEHPGVPRYQTGRAVVLRNRGLLRYFLGKPDVARRDIEASLKLLEAQVEPHADDSQRRHELANSMGDLSVVLRAAGEWDEAESLNRRENEVRRKLSEQRPDELEYRLLWLRSRLNLAQLLGARKKWPDALHVSQSVVPDLKEFVQRNPRNRLARRYLGIALINFGLHLRHSKQLKRAEQAGKESVDVFKELIGQFPERHAYLAHLSNACQMLAGTFESDGRSSDAEALCDQAIEAAERLAKRFSDVPYCQSELAAALNNGAAILKKIPQRHGEAAKLLLRAIDIRRSAMRAGDDTDEARQHLYLMHRNLTEIHCGLQEYGKASEVAAALFDGLPPTWPSCQKSLLCLNVVCRAVDSNTSLSTADRVRSKFCWQARAFDVLFGKPIPGVQKGGELRDILAAQRFIAVQLKGTAHRLEEQQELELAIKARRMEVRVADAGKERPHALRLVARRNRRGV